MSAALELDRVRKEYGGLRPLRVTGLRVETGQRHAVIGVDARAAEALANLLTGATLPDEGTVKVFGQDTAAVSGADVWLQLLDRFGMVSVRAVLIDDMTVAQNLAMAFTLSIDDLVADTAGRVFALAVEAGVLPDALDRPLGIVDPPVKARCHLARALAAAPSALLLDHANALTSPADAAAFGRDIARVATGRGLAVLAMTADAAFAEAVADRVWTLDGATGRLQARSAWRRLFG